MRRFGLVTAILSLFWILSGCDHHYAIPAKVSRIRTDQSFLKDENGRYMHIHGVNVSGSTKVPSSVDPVSYVGKPFPLKTADWNFKMLRDMGFNTLRLLVNWEGIEHDGIGEYDEDYLDYLEAIVAKANEYDIYCLMDMHQDIFSRRLYKLFNDGTDENSLLDLKDREKGKAYGLNNLVQGDGAPAWVVELCLPDKNVNGPEWGLPLQMVSDPGNTSDIIPFTWWGINMALSLDVDRCFASFFAGRVVFPNYKINGMNITDYLQNAYINAWLEVVKRVKKYPNVIGYDVMNEPIGYFITLPLYALLYQEISTSASGELTDQQVTQILENFLNSFIERGATADGIELLRSLFLEYGNLPKNLADLAKAGFFPQDASSPYRPDAAASININFAFNRNLMQPFLEKAGHAILDEDPHAVIFIEQAFGLPGNGIMGVMAEPMLAPEGIEQVVFAPHYYPDIYPYAGFNQPPREFTVDEIRFDDYTSDIQGVISDASFSLSNPPTLLGEFGSYFNYGGIETSIEQNYVVSSNILDNYYEDLDQMMLNNTIWCYSPENTKENGENWNKEDFSVLGPDHKPRSVEAYSRVYPRFASGRPKAWHYYSPFHYYTPKPGEPLPYLEFELEIGSKESDAPTEIFIPPFVFKDGFYVYISDGYCYFKNEIHVLYWFPQDDDPGDTHDIRIRPPYSDYGDNDWDYFFKGDQVIEGRK